jgi:hypothetical protein
MKSNKRWSIDGQMIAKSGFVLGFKVGLADRDLTHWKEYFQEKYYPN